MNSICKIMGMLNSPQSPVELMDNESFSIPFVSEHRGEMRLTLFSYSSQHSYGADGKTTVQNVYYINQNDLSDCDVQDAKALPPGDRTIRLFSRNNKVLKSVSVAEKYQRVLVLTDEILSGRGDMKVIVSEYADIASDLMIEELLPYYLTLGREYFLWLNSYI